MPKSLYIDPVKVREPGYIHFEDIPVCQYNKTIKQELEEGNYTKEDLIRIYRDMAICREFEHMLTLIKTQANYNGVETTYPGPAHLSLGQEFLRRRSVPSDEGRHHLRFPQKPFRDPLQGPELHQQALR